MWCNNYLGNIWTERDANKSRETENEGSSVGLAVPGHAAEQGVMRFWSGEISVQSCQERRWGWLGSWHQSAGHGRGGMTLHWASVIVLGDQISPSQMGKTFCLILIIAHFLLTNLNFGSWLSFFEGCVLVLGVHDKCFKELLGMYFLNVIWAWCTLEWLSYLCI